MRMPQTVAALNKLKPAKRLLGDEETLRWGW